MRLRRAFCGPKRQTVGQPKEKPPCGGLKSSVKLVGARGFEPSTTYTPKSQVRGPCGTYGTLRPSLYHFDLMSLGGLVTRAVTPSPREIAKPTFGLALRSSGSESNYLTATAPATLDIAKAVVVQDVSASTIHLDQRVAFLLCDDAVIDQRLTGISHA